jgi:hypothetical protein
MESRGFGLRQEAVLQTLTSEVLETSGIEGETLDAKRVRSSIIRALVSRLGRRRQRRRGAAPLVEREFRDLLGGNYLDV